MPPDILGARLLSGAARTLRRVGLKRAASFLSAIESQRHAVAHYSGEADDKDNARTTPPKDERVQLHSAWMVEVFPPSFTSGLDRALRRLPSAGVLFLDKSLADEVARARRYPRGGSWWNLGVFYNRLYGRRSPGSGWLDLPPQVDHLFLLLHLATPSLACAVAQFVTTDETASSLESILRSRHSTLARRKPDGVVQVSRPGEVKRDLVADELRHFHDNCRSWFSDVLPGAFSQGLLDGGIPTCWFLTLKQVRPFSDESRLDYVEPLGMELDFYALKADDLAGLRLSEPVTIRRPPHTYLLAGKEDEVFPGDDSMGGHGRGRGGFTVALLHRLDWFMAMWGLERTLLGYEMVFAKLRDSYAAMQPGSIRQNLAALTIAANNLAKLSSDAQAVGSDAGRLVDDQLRFEYGLPTFEPVQPDHWRLEGTWNDVLREEIGLSARRVRENEAAARDLEMKRASIISSRTNLTLQRSLRRLTWFLVILTVALIVLGAVTLDATW